VVQLDNITELERDMADICLYFPSLGSSENGIFFPGGHVFLLNYVENIIPKPYELKAYRFFCTKQ